MLEIYRLDPLERRSAIRKAMRSLPKEEQAALKDFYKQLMQALDIGPDHALEVLAMIGIYLNRQDRRKS